MNTTDKLRDAAQKALCALERVHHTTDEDRIAAADALRAALAQQDSRPAQSICTGCSNADSWGLPDKFVCRSCTSGSAWEPLTSSSVNLNKPSAQQDALAQQDAQAVPKGWKLVPAVPTPEMRKAAADAWIDCGDKLLLNKAAAALRAGIAAAPTPPVQQDAQAVPQGYKLVPVQPTPEMVYAAKVEGNSHTDDEIVDDYRAMLNAAPTPPAQQAPLEDGPPGSGGWKAYAGEVEKERDYWRQRAQTMHEHQRGEVWYWQGDGHDHPESMANSLPVVIRADALRELLAAPTPPAQEKQS